MRVGLYTDLELLDSETGDTRYLYDGLRTRFGVSVYPEPDVSRCAGDDVVFVRFRVPIRRGFLRALTTVRGKLIINEPGAQLRFGGKQNLFEFPDLIAPTLISRSATEIRRFAEAQGTIVLKPLDRHVGEGVTRIEAIRTKAATWAGWLADYLDRWGTPMAQRYLGCVEASGDKRINLFRYEPISAVRTLPAEGSFLSHRSLGGTELPASVSERDRTILSRVIPFLRTHHIWWAGIDVIGGFLSELNIVSPSMVWRADVAHGDTRGMDAMLAQLERYEAARAA